MFSQFIDKETECRSIDPGVGFFMVLSIGTSGGKHAHTPLVGAERFLVDHCPFLMLVSSGTALWLLGSVYACSTQLFPSVYITYSRYAPALYMTN